MSFFGGNIGNSYRDNEDLRYFYEKVGRRYLEGVTTAPQQELINEMYALRKEVTELKRMLKQVLIEVNTP